ncbi:MAG: CRISPR-associated protein Csx15 [Patescibacteria group bacterium]
MIKINFSGHPVAGFDVAPLVGANLPFEAATLAETVRELILALPGRDELLKGAKAEIILPGLGSAVAVLLAEWHGQFGNWPSIRWAVRGEKGFTWPDEARVDLNSVRESARTAR